VTRGLSLMALVNIPATCGLIVLAPEIIRLLFERGRFTAADTASTAFALRLYAVGLVGYSTTRIATPVFYALGRSRIPVALSSAAVVVNIVLSVTLVRTLGFGGLALATSLAALANASLCVFLLRRQLGGLHTRRLAATVGKVTLASAAMTLAVVTVNRALYDFASGGSAWIRALTLVAAIATGVVALVLTARVLRIEPIDDLRAQVVRRVRKLLNR
jgi:putative peptidoglycan lipid II flippase